MQQLTLIRGLPGSGKSTLAKQLQQTSNAFHIEADMYFINQSGEYCFKPFLLSQAHQWCFDQANQALSEGKSVIVSNTFVEYWELKPYLRLAKQLKVELDILVCRQQFQSIHDVPPETMRKMKKRWQEVQQ
ncbi:MULTISPECIES: ATP-binding protein [unclassified Vibrio]|uniref:ATP-binding protein n=1 Tax=Vibrio sp. HB236076 TaxID=3232307 RepID=A0AB39HCY7_9VIBR|nr:ATP-binding protein [Vibrio sp. HB161653]MDP5253429.1 ATP-binding protein [Vibrio sp. HB161653]